MTDTLEAVFRREAGRCIATMTRVLSDIDLADDAVAEDVLWHLTTVGTGWSLAGPPAKGKRSWPSPDGGRGNQRMSYERS